MPEDTQSQSNEDSAGLLGYDDFSKRIINHNEFAATLCKFTHWASPLIKYNQDVCGDNVKINYNKAHSKRVSPDKEYAVEMISVKDFLAAVDESIVEISLSFNSDKQPLVQYDETLSKRSVYAWGNNWTITHLVDNTLQEDEDEFKMWLRDIKDYNLNTRMWYPVNVITHAPWYNKASDTNAVLDKDYVCLGIDQAPAVSNIGLKITPQLNDILNVSVCPEYLLNDDLKPYAETYNQTVLQTQYSVDPDNQTGWLFVPVDGFIFTKRVTVKTIDNTARVRYFSFI